MKTTSSQPTKRKPDMDWAKTPCPNLIRYKPDGNYFGRVRVNGKLIRHALQTNILTVAKLKFSDFLPDRRRLAIKACVLVAQFNRVAQAVRGGVVPVTESGGQDEDFLTTLIRWFRRVTRA
jgi:hypothetical protein